jgi:nucleoside-diphosphate-sugar epimerase
MKILVTGGTGFVGSHSVRALAAAGHAVRLLARTPDKVKRTFEPHGLAVDDVVQGDVTDAGDVARALDGCDAVLHAAGLVDLRRSRAKEVLATNVGGMRQVVGGAHREGIRRIVYVSSSSVFFRPGGPPLAPDLPIPDGQSAYARSKAEAERHLRQLQEAGAPIHATYPTAILGPDDPGLSEGNHTLYTFLHELFAVTSSGFQVTDVRDLAALHVALLERDEGPGRWLAGGPMHPWADLRSEIEDLVGHRLRAVRLPGALLRAAGHVGDALKHVVDFSFPLTTEAMAMATQWPGTAPSQAEETLGVRFRPTRETLADTIRWLHRAGHVSAREAGRLAEGAHDR